MRSLLGAAHRTRRGTRRDMRCEIRKKIPMCIPPDMAVGIGRGWPQGAVGGGKGAQPPARAAVRPFVAQREIRACGGPVPGLRPAHGPCAWP